MTERLDRAFFARATEAVARDLVGCILVRKIAGEVVSGRIVETEAYGDETDLASHAAVYRRSRAPIMRAEPGSVYVYRSYGVHFCFNIVAHLLDGGGAVLIRAVEPTLGIELMAERRGTTVKTALTNGPGRLAQAFGFSLIDNQDDVVVSNDIALLAADAPVDVETSARIGITRDTDRPWRYFDPGSEFLSRSAARAGKSARSC